jgi:DNA-binding MarR family transcriptional regulator
MKDPKSTPNTTRPPVCALAATRKAARLLTQLYDSYLSEHSIESAQFALLMTIDAISDKGQAAVAQAMGMDKTTLSRNLKVLRANGWVASEMGTDARARTLALTKEGRDLLTRAKPSWRRAQNTLLRKIGPDLWKTTLQTLCTLATSASSVSKAKR